MNHQLHDSSPQTLNPNRPLRCLRHRVWMARCDDCRTAHSPNTRQRPETATATH